MCPDWDRTSGLSVHRLILNQLSQPARAGMPFTLLHFTDVVLFLQIEGMLSTRKKIATHFRAQPSILRGSGIKPTTSTYACTLIQSASVSFFKPHYCHMGWAFLAPNFYRLVRIRDQVSGIVKIWTRSILPETIPLNIIILFLHESLIINIKNIQILGWCWKETQHSPISSILIFYLAEK